MYGSYLSEKVLTQTRFLLNGLRQCTREGPGSCFMLEITVQDHDHSPHTISHPIIRKKPRFPRSVVLDCCSIILQTTIYCGMPHPPCLSHFVAVLPHMLRRGSYNKPLKLPIGEASLGQVNGLKGNGCPLSGFRRRF